MEKPPGRNLWLIWAVAWYSVLNHSFERQTATLVGVWWLDAGVGTSQRRRSAGGG